MAYNKKTWTNRTSEYPNRYRMTSANGNIADVAIVPNEGNVTAEGDKFSADTMNNLETRIKNGFDSADSSISTLNTTLRGLISNEQTRAVGVETLIQGDVDALESNLASEVSRATGAENTLSNNLASEVTRATGVENGHNTRITSLEGRMGNAESDIDTLESAIAGFQTSLDTEVTRATNAESTLTTNLQAETARATNAENVLDTRVTTLETITTRAYKASGSVYFADLPLAVESRQGNIYDILDAFTTTDDFLEGPGNEYPAHTDVVIVGVEGDYYNEVTPSGEENPSEEGWYVYDSTEEEYVLTQDTSVQSGTTYYSYANVKYMYNIGTGFFDTSNFVQKTDYATLLAAGIVKPDGTTITIDNDGTMHGAAQGQGGHTITDGTTLFAQRAKLKFENATVTDDATNDQTIVKSEANIPQFTQAEWNALTDEEKASYDGKTFVIIDDYNEMTVDSVMSTTSTNPLQNKVITQEIQTLENDVQALTNNDDAMLNVLGAKNLLLNNATTQVVNGVTFTVNPSGYLEGTVKVNGTASEDTWFGLTGVNVAVYSKRNYGNCYLSGGISGEIQLQVYWSDDGSTWGGTIVSRGTDALIPNKNYYSQVLVFVKSGTTVNNAIVYPMIRPVGTDDTYVPYAMTNRDLTQALTNVKNDYKKDLANYQRTGSTNTGSAINKGTYFYIDDTLTYAKEDIAQNATFTSSNCETVTAGALNNLQRKDWTLLTSSPVTASSYTKTEMQLSKYHEYIIVFSNSANDPWWRYSVVLHNQSYLADGHTYIPCTNGWSIYFTININTWSNNPFSGSTFTNADTTTDAYIQVYAR